MPGASSIKLAERQPPKTKLTTSTSNQTTSTSECDLKSTTQSAPSLNLPLDLDMFFELSEECVRTGSSTAYSTAIRLTSKIATVPGLDTKERIAVLRRTASAVGKSMVENPAWPHLALPITHDFVTKAVIKLISKVSHRNDDSLVEEIVSLLVCLAVQLGKSDEALVLLNQLSDRILNLPADARFGVFPAFVKALTSLWLKSLSDFNQMSSIITVVSKTLANIGSANQGDCFDQSMEPIQVHIHSSRNLLFATSLFEKLFLLLRERLEHGDPFTYYFYLRIIAALEKLRSGGVDFSIEPLATVWASSIKTGIAVLLHSFPSLPDGSVSMEGFEHCITCNEVCIEQCRVVDGLTRGQVSELKSWLCRVDKLRPWFNNVVKDLETRERLLDVGDHTSRLYKRLSVFREPAIHYHELIPVSPSSCSQSPYDLEPAPIPTPLYSNDSAPIDRTGSRFRNEKQRVLGTGNLSSVMEVDAEMEESADSTSSTREPSRAAPSASGSAVQAVSKTAQPGGPAASSSGSTGERKTSLPSSTKRAPAATREENAAAGKVPPPPPPTSTAAKKPASKAATTAPPPPPPPSTIPLKRTHIPAPLDLDSNNRGKRARSEALTSPPPRPEGVAGGSKASTISNAGATGQTRGPRSTQASIRPPGSSNATASSSRIATRPSLPRRSSSLPPAPPSKAPLPLTKSILTEPSVVESPNSEMSVAEDFATGSAPRAEADNIVADEGRLEQEVQVVEGQDVGLKGSSAQGSNELIGEGSKIGGVGGSSFDFTFTRTSAQPSNPPGVETRQGYSSSAPRDRIASTSATIDNQLEGSSVALEKLETIFSPRNQTVKPALAVKEPRRSIRLVGLPPGPQV
ncbi:hypothetical protein SISNIDRAFT_482602 [Sistotremastrum niveocremeum HHB9708]|uniref:Uncharacterized protein n=1 Tax=Sistotremastrum niveocremeum HHB9708 TaxID=1314777 RepID=A0A164YD98_9AGAM|nr:hypothetical protein SISNIDRAFT_482602 [Sistotremastrum niveocremeum HHB9708]